MTLLDFYREDAILHAKQLLVHAAERIDCLNIQNFSKKRSGINKIKSSADDIMNILRIVDEHLGHELMPTFCAVNRSRVPVIAEKLSDMAAVRLELTTLREHVETLAKKLSEVSPCKCQRVKDTVVRRVIDVSNDAQAAYDKNVCNTSKPEPILGNNSDSMNIAAHENDYPLLTYATLSAVSTIRNSGNNQSFAATAKQDMHKFDEINRASRQMQKRNQNRYVVGDSVMNAPFAGVSKKVFSALADHSQTYPWKR